jgi:hypothetical protein
VSSISVSGSDPAPTTTTLPTTIATLPPGAMAFEELTSRFGHLLEMIKRPGTVPVAVLSKEDVAPVFAAKNARLCARRARVSAGER